VPFQPPRSLSPSKVTSFRDCALAFRFTAIDRLPEEPTPWTVKGTLVHTALERLFWNHERGLRTLAAATAELDRAWAELQEDPEFVALDLAAEAAEQMRVDADGLIKNYFTLEDPNEVNPIGVEITLEARLGSMRLRGIIDRLDLTPEGDLVIVDYKTGRAPSANFEHSKLVGVHIYALLCHEVLGKLPTKVRLLHLREPVSITADTSEQALRGQRQKAVAVWSAIERACEQEDFRPRPSRLCDYCQFKAFCPAFGGDPDAAALALDGAVEAQPEAADLESEAAEVGVAAEVGA
jgi:putative RecB family exonuclease